MQLTITQRLTLDPILARHEGRAALIRAIRTARQDLELDETDHHQANIRQDYTCPKCRLTDYYPIVAAAPTCPLCATLMLPGQQLRWDPRTPAREIALSPAATNIIADHFRTLEADGKLRADLLDLYEKFTDSQEITTNPTQIRRPPAPG